MTATEKPDFARLMSALCAAMGAECDAAMLEGYWLALRDMDLPSVRRAVSSALQECTWMPKPGELRQRCGVVTAQQRCVVAFEAVSRAAASVGSYHSVDFEDPIVNATIRNMGGWERLCAMRAEEYAVWGRKEFERIYQALLGTGVSAESARYLPGREERENGESDWGGRRKLREPVAVRVGLPAHKQGTVRELENTGKIFSIAAGIKQIEACK